MVLLNEWLQVLCLSCGTRGLRPPPLSITPLFGPFSRLLLLVDPHPEPIPLSPTSATGPTAPLEGALDLLDSVPLPEAPPSPDPLYTILQCGIEHLEKADCMPQIGSSGLIFSSNPMLFPIYLTNVCIGTIVPGTVCYKPFTNTTHFITTQ